MKFRTEIEIAPQGVKIGYENRMLALGSCFAEHIAARLAQAKFRIAANPIGILFNPLSIAAAIRAYAGETPALHSELGFDGELWFHYGFHGSFSAPDAAKALEGMNAARMAGAGALREADRVLLTFGTAWVFERRGEVVANCHKQAPNEFSRRRLSVAEIVDTFAKLVAGPLAGKEIILTVSPVRHLGDSLEGNAVSKATLRLAAEELSARFGSVHYFPAYEILCDDLRDYRFYADDMVHPAPRAVEYVWEKFSTAMLSDQALKLIPAVERITAAMAHRPRNPQSEVYMEFCRRRLAEIEALPGVDFTAETEYFRDSLKINS